MKQLNVITALVSTAALTALTGCCMCLEKPQPMQTEEIIAQHQEEANREAELNLLCDKAWVPVYIRGQEGTDGKNAIVLPPDVEAYILFSRDGKLSGFAGVSPFSGSFVVQAPNRLRVGGLSSSQKAGTHLDYEMLFMVQLNEVNKFSILPDGTLEMLNRDMVMLRCKPVAVKDLKQQSQKAAAKPAAQPAAAAPAAKPAAQPAAAAPTAKPAAQPAAAAPATKPAAQPAEAKK